MRVDIAGVGFVLLLISRFPQQRVLSNEPEEHRLYHWAFRRGRENTQQECSDMFPQCPVSLVDMALGYYSEFGDGNNALHQQQ